MSEKTESWVVEEVDIDQNKRYQLSMNVSPDVHGKFKIVVPCQFKGTIDCIVIKELIA